MNDNKPDLKNELRPMLAASSVGMVFVVSIALGALLGYWLDGKLGTKPYLTIFFMCIGIASGVKNVIYFIRKSGALEDVEIPPQTGEESGRADPAPTQPPLSRDDGNNKKRN